MKTTATKAARDFSDLLNRVHYRGEEFVIERNGEPICRMSPVERRFVKGSALLDYLKSAPKADPDFASDLEEIRAAQPAVPDPRW